MDDFSIFSAQRLSGGGEGFAEDVVDAGFPVGVGLLEATDEVGVQGDGDVFYHGDFLALGAGAAMGFDEIGVYFDGGSGAVGPAFVGLGCVGVAGDACVDGGFFAVFFFDFGEGHVGGCELGECEAVGDGEATFFGAPFGHDVGVFLEGQAVEVVCVVYVNMGVLVAHSVSSRSGWICVG